MLKGDGTSVVFDQIIKKQSTAQKRCPYPSWQKGCWIGHSTVFSYGCNLL